MSFSLASIPKLTQWRNLFAGCTLRQKEAGSLVQMEPLLSLEEKSQIRRDEGIVDARRPPISFGHIFRVSRAFQYRRLRSCDETTSDNATNLSPPDDNNEINREVNQETFQEVELANSTGLNETEDPKERLYKYMINAAGVFNANLTSVTSKKKCLIMLSSILKTPMFFKSLTLSQHEEIIGLINKTLVTTPQHAEFVYEELLAPLLDSNTPNMKPYREFLLEGFITMLGESEQSEDKRIVLKNNLILNKLINTPTFLASLTSKQHQKLAAIFQSRITAPINSELCMHDIKAANVLVRQRDAYIAFAGIIFINGYFSTISLGDRKIWISSMNTVISELYASSVFVTDLDARRNFILNLSQKTVFESKTKLCTLLNFLKKGLITYKNTLESRSSSGNEKTSLEDAIQTLDFYLFQIKAKKDKERGIAVSENDDDTWLLSASSWSTSVNSFLSISDDDSSISSISSYSSRARY